ncbi:hypothetical protein [uncultured Acinetobacter sp.]|jgi:hypothetical protein|nr:hypothetical protein [uncultured Acinetobacter sp.]
MKAIILTIMMTMPVISFAGNCDHSWQNDKNGNSCGDRAADRRDGGR